MSREEVAEGSLRQLWRESSWKERVLLPFIGLMVLAMKAILPPSYPCPQCQTDLMGRGNNCPECGYAFTAKGELRNLREDSK